MQKVLLNRLHLVLQIRKIPSQKFTFLRLGVGTKLGLRNVDILGQREQCSADSSRGERKGRWATRSIKYALSVSN